MIPSWLATLNNLDANYLNIKELLNLVCETIVDVNKERTPEENPKNVEHQE
ncbi:hypothetical protein R6Q59_027632 [Mikania micrantha]